MVVSRFAPMSSPAHAQQRGLSSLPIHCTEMQCRQGEAFSSPSVLENYKSGLVTGINMGITPANRKPDHVLSKAAIGRSSFKAKYHNFDYNVLLRQSIQISRLKCSFNARSTIIFRLQCSFKRKCFSASPISDGTSSCQSIPLSSGTTQTKRRANEVRSKNNGCDKPKTGYSRYTASINRLSPLIWSSSRFLLVDSFVEVSLI
ncbi:hypothetical protein CEXT_231441 [Caerostris extrusa]|uniref:Uncharacterized protein n=1 Tax=Caerostris extrusa TaxID=172846 RepID=A0AAV4QM37_CAEEX|nr:hypothetical protein CEXT_231441 [Caerostris extrusa]